MSTEDSTEPAPETIQALQARAAALEQQLREVEVQSAERLRHAELKAEAVRAGIVDLDGLKLLDPATMAIRPSGEPAGAAEIIAKLRRDKPWLFTPANSGSAATPPPAAPVKRKMAADMSVEEWRAARAELIRRR